MDKAKKLLNISIGISLVLCSFSLLIFSTRNNIAKAQNVSQGNYVVVGLLNEGIGKYCVIGYNKETGGTKILAHGKY